MKKQILILTLFTISVFAFSCKKSESDPVDKLVGNWLGYSLNIPTNYPGVPDFLVNDSILLNVKENYEMTLGNLNGTQKYDGYINIYQPADTVFELIIFLAGETYRGNFVNNNYTTASGILGNPEGNRRLEINLKKQ